MTGFSGEQYALPERGGAARAGEPAPPDRGAGRRQRHRSAQPGRCRRPRAHGAHGPDPAGRVRRRAGRGHEAGRGAAGLTGRLPLSRRGPNRAGRRSGRRGRRPRPAGAGCQSRFRGVFAVRVDGAHEADVAAVGVLDDRVAGAPERVVGRLATLVPGRQQLGVPSVDRVTRRQREPEDGPRAAVPGPDAGVPDCGHLGVVELDADPGEAHPDVVGTGAGRPFLRLVGDGQAEVAVEGERGLQIAGDQVDLIELRRRVRHRASPRGGARPTRRRGSGERPGDLFELVGLDDVARMEVLEVGEADAALEAGLDLAGVVLEPLQRGDRSRSRSRRPRGGAGPGAAGDRAVWTKQPATVPTRGILKTSRTTARPVRPP